MGNSFTRLQWWTQEVSGKKQQYHKEIQLNLFTKIFLLNPGSDIEACFCIYNVCTRSHFDNLIWAYFSGLCSERNTWSFYMLMEPKLLLIPSPYWYWKKSIKLRRKHPEWHVLYLLRHTSVMFMLSATQLQTNKYNWENIFPRP